jgi:hypothetical protein
VSIRINVIARSKELRNRAAQTLSLFVAVLLAAIALAIPGQAHGPLGAELIGLALILAAVLLILDRRARSETPAAGIHAIGRMLDIVVPNTITSILLFLGLPASVWSG